MGSGISRMGQRPPQTAEQAMHRPRFTLASLLCGTSFDDDPPQLEDQSDDSSSTTLESPPSIGDSFMNDGLHRSAKSSSSSICSESISSGQTGQQSYNGHNEGSSTDFSSRNIETSLSGKDLLKSKEVVLSQRHSDVQHQEPSSRGFSEQASSSAKPVRCGPLSTSRDAILSPITEEHSTDNDYQNNANRSSTSNMPQQEVGNLPANNTLIGNRADVEPGARSSSADSSSTFFSDRSATQHSSEEEPDEGVAALDPGLFIPLRARQRRSGSILHVDIVSISSNVFSRNSGDTGNHEARRNSRRLFWDAFSRRSSERDDASPSILFSTEDTDDLASHDRWLLNLTSDFFGNGGEASEYHGRHSTAERRWRSRSEIREGLRAGPDERSHSGRSTLCASGLHPDGTCSCETFLLAEGSGTRASISRIVMLAEALFEVLDEIHRQPVPWSLSMVSRPAPESVVNSFPLKIHRKSNTAESGDVEQCYICLAEYEEGDSIRVLPCRHEYHMSCVDKWLKEIHGVCPLCRGDVSSGAAECPTSNSL